MSTILIERRYLPEVTVDGKPLGRHVNHDSRSKNFPVRKLTTSVSKKWTRYIGPLDQLNVGACTGNASDGVLATDPHYYNLQKLFPNQKWDEALALKIYGFATQLDSYKGTYPPTDTGSDGLSAAKACKELGFISGYTHAFSIDDLIAGLQFGPAIVGTDWLGGMDTPDGNGLVHATGARRGGHEYECWEVDLENNLLGFWQSWGNWGVGGKFYVPIPEFTTLLKDDGDATFFTPLSEPAPTPTPGPSSGSVSRSFVQSDFVSLNDWANSPHVFHKATLASKAWKNGV